MGLLFQTMWGLIGDSHWGHPLVDRFIKSSIAHQFYDLSSKFQTMLPTLTEFVAKSLEDLPNIPFSSVASMLKWHVINLLRWINICRELLPNFSKYSWILLSSIGRKFPKILLWTHLSKKLSNNSWLILSTFSTKSRARVFCWERKIILCTHFMRISRNYFIIQRKLYI